MLSDTWGAGAYLPKQNKCALSIYTGNAYLVHSLENTHYFNSYLRCQYDSLKILNAHCVFYCVLRLTFDCVVVGGYHSETVS